MSISWFSERLQHDVRGRVGSDAHRNDVRVDRALPFDSIRQQPYPAAPIRDGRGERGQFTRVSKCLDTNFSRSDIRRQPHRVGHTNGYLPQGSRGIAACEPRECSDVVPTSAVLRNAAGLASTCGFEVAIRRVEVGADRRKRSENHRISRLDRPTMVVELIRQTDETLGESRSRLTSFMASLKIGLPRYVARLSKPGPTARQAEALGGLPRRTVRFHGVAGGDTGTRVEETRFFEISHVAVLLQLPDCPRRAHPRLGRKTGQEQNLCAIGMQHRELPR